MCRSVGSRPENSSGKCDGWMGGVCLVRAGWPREQSGVDTRRPWFIPSMFGRGPVWGSQLVRMTECGLTGRGSADVEGPASWNRSVMI